MASVTFPVRIRTRDEGISYIDLAVSNIEGREKKTILIGLREIASFIGTSPKYIAKYISKALNSRFSCQYDFLSDKLTLEGQISCTALRQQMASFMASFALCPNCNLHELLFKGHQRKGRIQRKCNSCGYRKKSIAQTPAMIFLNKAMLNHASDAWRLKYYKYEHEFLRGCRNSKSLFDNFELLLSGYMKMDKLIPNDIACLIFQQCYKWSSFHKETDRWSSTIAENSFSEIKKDGIMLSLEEYNVAMTHRVIDNYLIRKVWRFKLINHVSHCFRIQLKERKNDVEGTKTIVLMKAANIKIQNGDVISIIFINYESKAWVQIEINDKKAKSLDIDAEALKLSRQYAGKRKQSYRLTLLLAYHVEIQLLQ